MSTINLQVKPSGKGGRAHVVIKLPDGDAFMHVFDLSNETSRGGFVDRVCERCPGINADALRAELVREAERLVFRPPAENPPDTAAPDDDDATKAAALAMLRDPELIVRIRDDIAALGVVGERALAATVYLVGTSRLLPRPLAAIVQGPTSSGKSFTVNTVAKMFPPEDTILAHKMTPEALVHMPAGGLVHRLVVGGERTKRQDDDAADATKALREMLSDGRLTKLMPVKTKDGIETIQIDQPGPIAYVETTTVQNILDEDRNRCIVLNTDERPEQTRRIIAGMAARRVGRADDAAVEAIIRRHRAAQRLLRRVRVVIPFAERLGELFPADRTDSRRSFGHLLSAVEAVALLHQYQRVNEPEDGIEISATLDDYAIARRLLAGPFARTLAGGVSAAAERLLERIATYALPDEFVVADVADQERVIGDRNTIRAHLRALVAAGRLELVEAARGRTQARYRLADRRDDAEAAGLPTVHDVMDSSPRHPVNAQSLCPA